MTSCTNLRDVSMNYETTTYVHTHDVNEMIEEVYIVTILLDNVAFTVCM